jgi:hypothetical protein
MEASVGITVRDWLAAHATEADIEDHRNYRFCPQTKCLLSCRTREAARYAYADAMIVSRKTSIAKAKKAPEVEATEERAVREELERLKQINGELLTALKSCQFLN